MTRRPLTPGQRAAAVTGAWMLFTVVQAAGVPNDPDRACDAHAAAMVAEMQASSASPLTEGERALVRRTALKSCLSRRADVEPAAGEATAQAPATTAAAGKPRRDETFLEALDRTLDSERDRREGHDRLRRRGRY